MIRDLVEAMNNHPTFSLVVKESNNYFRGLTYEFMENYIAANDKAERIMDEFNALRYGGTSLRIKEICGEQRGRVK